MLPWRCNVDDVVEMLGFCFLFVIGVVLVMLNISIINILMLLFVPIFQHVDVIFSIRSIVMISYPLAIVQSWKRCEDWITLAQQMGSPDLTNRTVLSPPCSLLCYTTYFLAPYWCFGMHVQGSMKQGFTLSSTTGPSHFRLQTVMQVFGNTIHSNAHINLLNQFPCLI